MSYPKKPLWICTNCKRPNWHNKTVCYHCARRRNYGKSPDQQQIWPKKS